MEADDDGDLSQRLSTIREKNEEWVLARKSAQSNDANGNPHNRPHPLSAVAKKLTSNRQERFDKLVDILSKVSDPVCRIESI